MYLKQVILIFLLTSTASVIKGDEGSNHKLPSIWIEEEGEVNYYRFRAELELLEGAKSFIIEEWASLWRQSFRFDLIKSPGDTRTTFLANKQTSEKFRFEPFTCSLINQRDSAQDLGASISGDIAKLFPIDSSDTMLPVGIGSLWLHAMKLESSFTPASDEESSRRAKTSSLVLRKFDKYTVASGENYPFGISFYFRESASLLGVTGLKSLAIVEVHDSSKRVLMRIKMLESESNGQYTLREDQDYLDVFDLPFGYGCQRDAQLDHPIPDTAQQQSGGAAQVIQLDMVSTQPIDLEHDFEQWKSHSVSAKLFTGYIDLNEDKQARNNYLIMETQDYAPEENSPKMYRSEMRQATMRRIRHVWDLGASTDAQNDKSEIRYFKLNELTGECLISRELNRNTFVNLTEDDTSANKDPLVPLEELTLNSELLLRLLFDTHGYHLLKDGEPSTGKRARESVYERRFDIFAMRNALGELVWKGPVSVIRYYKETQVTSAVVYFLSKNLDKLISKFHIRAQPIRSISEAYLHQSLNVASCLYESTNRLSTNDQQLRQKDKNVGTSFSVAYSIDPEELTEEIANSEEFEILIYKRFLQAMLKASNDQLDPLQLIDLDVDFDSNQSEAEISARLLDRPSVFSYHEVANLRFSTENLPPNSLKSELTINEEVCAEVCQQHSCLMFVYCKETKVCDLLTADLKHQASGTPLFDPDFGCSLYRARPGRNEPSKRVDPTYLLYHLQQTISDSSEEEENNPVKLELRIEYTDAGGSKNMITMTPYELVGEFSDIGSGNESEYVVKFSNKKYEVPPGTDSKELFSVQEAQHMSYEECLTLCEESDCQSFSYCQMEKTCQVSQIPRDGESIEKYTKQEDLCFVVIREVVKRKSIHTQEVIEPEKSSVDQTDDTRDDNSSVEEKGFNYWPLICILFGAIIGYGMARSERIR